MTTLKNELLSIVTSALMLAFLITSDASAAILAENTHVIDEASALNDYSNLTLQGDGVTYEKNFGAENFTLGGTYNITSISHVGHLDDGLDQPKSIDWRIYADDGGLPGVTLFSADEASYTTTAEGSYDVYYDIFRYSIDLSTSGITLTAGNYWVGFHNNTQEEAPHWTFASAGTSFDGLNALSYDGGAIWQKPYIPGGIRDGLTFRVQGISAVPIPTAVWLFGSGLLSLVGIAGRKKAA
jgi:hypothetical protein